MHGRISMLHDDLCSYDNLLLAFRKARKGKSAKWYVGKFEKNLERNLIKLEAELRHGTYKPHPMKEFVIRDPKTRVISSSHFCDRVVHHAICNIIEPIFEKSFIYDSYASRKNRGTHAALKRFDEFKRKASQNGRLVKKAKNSNMVIGYVLKADVRHYFDTVDHDVLLNILEKKIKDEKIIWLIEKIIENHNEHRGMPIGNLTSQFFANVYLNELDKFIKHKLLAKYYIRYLDDFVILHKDRYVLQRWKDKIEEFLKNELHLELHPEKSKIYALRHGINFLGFRIFYHYKLLKKSNLTLIGRKIGELHALSDDGTITKDEIQNKLDGWVAYAKHGNTYKLCKKLIKRV
jgi:retron-type reverse transcriptase